MTPLWRIGHVDTERGFSGGEVQVFLLLEGLRRRGHEVILFCRPNSRCEAEAKLRNIEAVSVPMANDLDWRGFTALARTFREHHLDLVHLHTGRAAWLGGLAAWRSGLKAVSTRRMDRTVKPNWRNRAVYGKFVERVIAISPAVVECLRAGEVPEQRIVLIPEAVDPCRVQIRRPRDLVRSELGVDPGNCVLLSMAALVHRKGLDVLLDALSLLAEQGPRPVLWIAGDGAERAVLEGQVAQLGLGAQVRFLGRREDAADLYAACDIFVLPSRREGLGVAALEAMASARPVVCSAVGGLTYSVVQERTGLLVPPNDPQELSRALLQLIRNPSLRRRLGDAGPARIAEEFTTDRMVDAHLQVYERVLAPIH